MAGGGGGACGEPTGCAGGNVGGGGDGGGGCGDGGRLGGSGGGAHGGAGGRLHSPMHILAMISTWMPLQSVICVAAVEMDGAFTVIWPPTPVSPQICVKHGARG